MKNDNNSVWYFSAYSKSRIAAIISVFLVLFAVILLFFGNNKKGRLTSSNAYHYDLVKDYMQTEYTNAYADYFDVAYVEELADYNEMTDDNGKNIEASFLMKVSYQYPYRDPDTVQKVIEARESGDMAEYKRLYDDYNKMKNAEYPLKIEAKLENGLKDAVLYAGTEEGKWILLKNGLKDYIIED